MRTRIAGLFFASFLVVGCGQSHTSGSKLATIGGRSLTSEDPGFLSAVGITFKVAEFDSFYCSGVLISPTHVLTAAHCLKRFSFDRLTVHFSESVYNKDPQTRRTIKSTSDVSDVVFPHKDIATFELSEAAPEFAFPDDATGGDQLIPEEEIAIVGYGPVSDSTWHVSGKRTISFNKFNRYLRTDEVPGAALFGKIENHGASSGDSGGPIYVKRDGSWRLVGVVSGADLYDCKTNRVHSGCGMFTLIPKE